MNESIKQRIRDRLDGVRYVVEQNCEETEGEAYAFHDGQLVMLNVVEKLLAEFLADDAAE